MDQSRHKNLDPGHKGRPYMEECDIGSGEKTPAQMETEEMIREIPPLPPSSHRGADDTGPQGGGQPPSKG
jgi:hypothetical protein